MTDLQAPPLAARTLGRKTNSINCILILPLIRTQEDELKDGTMPLQLRILSDNRDFSNCLIYLA